MVVAETNTVDLCVVDSSKSTMSKVGILRGLITEKMSVAVREILAVVEKTVFGYEEEVLSLRRELEDRKRVDAFLHPRVRLHRIDAAGGARATWSRVSADARRDKQRLKRKHINSCGASEKRKRKNEVNVVATEESPEESDGPVACLLSSDSEFCPDDTEEMISDGPGTDVQIARSKRQRRLPARYRNQTVTNKDTKKIREKIRDKERTPIKNKTPQPLIVKKGYKIKVTVCLLKNCPNTDPSNQGSDSDDSVQTILCQQNLSEPDFLNNLRSTFPELGENKQFEAFLGENQVEKSVPDGAKTMTPKELYTAFRAHQRPRFNFCIKLKEHEEPCEALTNVQTPPDKLTISVLEEETPSGTAETSKVTEVQDDKVSSMDCAALNEEVQDGGDDKDGQDEKDDQGGKDGEENKGGQDIKDNEGGGNLEDGKHYKDGIDVKDYEDGHDRIVSEDGQDRKVFEDGQDGKVSEDGQDGTVYEDGLGGKDNEDGQVGKDNEQEDDDWSPEQKNQDRDDLEYLLEDYEDGGEDDDYDDDDEDDEDDDEDGEDGLGDDEDDWTPELNDDDEDTSDFEKRRRQSCDSCKLCGVSFSSRSILTKHALSHLDDPKHLCGVCGDQVETSEELKSHLETHQKLHQCDKCGRFFFTFVALHKHGETCTGEKSLSPTDKPCQKDEPYKCDVCFKSFSFKGALHIHSRKHKSETTFSEKSLSNDQSLDQHKVTDTGERTFDCDHCGKRFLFIQLLKNHEKIHTVTQKSYLCDICSKIFSTEELLNKHQAIHRQRRQAFAKLTKVEPVFCKVCGLKFKLRRDLRIHMNSCHGDKPFVCSVCGYRTKRKQHFDDHMNIHTGNRPYKCSQCNLGFQQKHCLKTHMRKVHESSAPTDLQRSTTEEQAAAETLV